MDSRTARPSYYRKHNLVETRYADLGKTRSGHGSRRLAYCKIEGSKRPGIIYVPGYFSRMFIAKANIIEEFCLKKDYPFIKYDPEGIGESRTETEEVSFGEWFEDACYVIEHLTEGPQMLVGASNGGWMSLLLAMKYPGRIHSIVMLAPGVNHGLDEDLYEKLMQALDEETAGRVLRGETVKFQSSWGVEVTASKRFMEELKDFRISMDQPVPVPSTCPVRIIHSIEDSTVFWENCVQLMRALSHDDVRLYLKKRGDHTLMMQEDLHLQMAVIEELLTRYPVEKASNASSTVVVAPLEAPSNVAAPSDSRPNIAALPQSLMDGVLNDMGKRTLLRPNTRQMARSKL